MGVLYASSDDVADLLIPFVRDNGGSSDPAHVADRYLDVSGGVITPAAFWESVCLAPDVESAYLATHTAMPYALRFLIDVRSRFARTCCISNDVAPWSQTLRQRFGFNALIDDWFISSELRMRKPDKRMFHYVLQHLGVRADRLIFIDDRRANVEAAADLGIVAVHFGRDATQSDIFDYAQTFEELNALINRITVGRSSG